MITRSHLLSSISVVVAVCQVACTQQELPALNVAFPISVPSAPGATAPRIATHPSGVTTLSWMERDTEGVHLNFSRYTTDVWQSPTTVVVDPEMFVNWADRPAITPLANDVFLAHWLRQNGEDPHAYDILTSFSNDGGQSWGEPVRPHNDNTPTEHGFVSAYAMGDQTGLIWLDGRKMINPVDDDPATSAMTLRGATLSVGETGTATISDNAIIDAMVCDCCPTGVAQTPSGAVAVYRNRTADEIRDIYVTRRVDGKWQPGVPVSNDNWSIAGCPVNGPSIAANAALVVVGWFSAADDKPMVQAAYSTDSGRSFSEPIQIATRKSLGQVGAVLISDRSFAISWLEADNESTFIINVRTMTTDGQISEIVRVGRTEYAYQVPQLSRVGDKLIVAWTDEYNDASKIVSVRLPIVNFYDL